MTRHTQWLAIALLSSCLAAAEDAQPAPSDEVARARVEGILSMYAPDGALPDDCFREFLVHEGPAAVPPLVFLVKARLEGSAEGSQFQAPTELLLDVLGRLRDERALAVLEDAIRTGPQGQRQAAALALGHFHSSAALGALLRALGQYEPGRFPAVVEAIKETARSMPGTDVARKVLDAARKDRTLRAGAAEVVVALDPQLGDALLQEMLSDADGSIRTQAVRLLSQTQTRDAEPEVLRLLQDQSLQVRKEASLALGRLKTTAAVPDLIALLEPDVDPGLRGNASWALRQITGQVLTDDADLWRRWWELNQPKPEEK